MERAAIDGTELEYELAGSGDPVVLIHAGLCADFFLPLAEQPAFAGHFTVLMYHRTGYAGSDRLPGAVSLERQAAQCWELMHHLGIERAHVAGHSSSACMALQLALDHPEAVAGLALLAARPAAPVFRERRDLLLAWLPNAEAFELPGATHLLHVQNPGAMANALVEFFSRHEC
jgi:pimeloyl-ACP methyl ester carboxylesterase